MVILQFPNDNKLPKGIQLRFIQSHLESIRFHWIPLDPIKLPLESIKLPLQSHLDSLKNSIESHSTPIRITRGLAS